MRRFITRWPNANRREEIMAETQTEPKLILPFLRPFYDTVIPLSWLIVRVAVGWNFLVHGWGKITVGPSPGILKAFGDLGFTSPEPWFWAALVLETSAAISLILGLFTRFFAAAAAIEMVIITAVYWRTGFSWLQRGYEYTLLWGWVCFAIALRGGSPYSLDRVIGREL
jgi:putative oxidoreductase